MELKLDSRKKNYIKIRWIVWIRSLLSSFCLLLLVLYEVGGAFSTPAYLVLVLIMSLNLVYIHLLPYIQDWGRFAVIQTVIDSLGAFLLVYFTGGVVSIFTFVYFVLIFAWTMLLSGHASLYFASLATIFLSVITIASFFKHLLVLPFFSYEWLGDLNQRKNKILATFFAQSLGFYAVAVLSIALSRGLQRVKILYHEILENMKEGVLVMDHLLNLVYINAEARRLIELHSKENLVGKKLDEIFLPHRFKRLGDLLESRKEGDFEVELFLEDGTSLHLGLKLSLIYEENKTRGSIVIFEDLTLKKQLQAMKRRTLRLEGIEEMALGIAHEIRNPLASIRGCVQELSHENDSDYSKELGNIIISESDRLDRILEQFLDFTKPTQLRLKKVDLNSLIREVLLLVENHQKGRDLEIKTILLPDPVYVMCDGDKILQIFFNLAFNALEAGATQLEIRFSPSYMPLQIDGDHRFFSKIETLLIEFIDNGSGIKEENYGKIFTPFFTTKSSGTGLGLSIVSKILKQHQGHIEVENSPERGAIFKIWLPLSPIGYQEPPGLKGKENG